jgi:SIR2-like domain
MDVESSIETIALALAARDGRGGGRATAMIGAGFSRNAKQSSENSREFPLWREIVRPLVDELLPPCPQCPRPAPCPPQGPTGCLLGERRRRLFEDAAGASGMMSLGDKFEARNGSARLRAALKTAVPDEDYKPGLAHQLLVRLPWADIFTTNWDTLLERAVDTYDRSYDPVVTVEQIASTCAPRIVKLHGCARSGSRLIFTEEDFRTYPKTFAPFVSLVQQSLMENVIVLFGFSGADPNFRAWHGWVRDHLGSNIQPIYLVTLRPTDPIDVNLMAGRLINQIDLSQKQEWRHATPSEMIENFLSEIHRRLRNLRVNLDWPVSRRIPSDGGPSADQGNNQQDWRQRLNSYPRWLVAPARNRADFLLGLDEALGLAFDPGITRGGLAKLTEKLDAKIRKRDVDFLTERETTAIIVAESLRIALARPANQLFDHLKGILAGALNDLFTLRPDAPAEPGVGAPAEPDQFNPLRRYIAGLVGDVGDLDEAACAQKIFEARPSDRSLAGDHSPTGVTLRLLPLIEVVEREARLRDEPATARTLRDILWLTGGEGPGRELAVRGALAFALTHLQIQEIDALLSLWPDQPHDAASNLRHAATLRDIGWIKESYEEISKTVQGLRSLGSARRRGVGETSREAWAFYLYADLLEANKETLRDIVAPHQRHLSIGEVIIELHERLDELETNRCDPRREIDRLSRELDAATIQTRLSSGTPLRMSFRPSLQYVVADPASTFVIMSETVGVSTNHAYGGSRLALTAARLLAPTHRKLAIGLLLRAGTPEDLRFTEPGGSSSRSGDAANVQPAGDDNWRVADVVFDKANNTHDFKMLAQILDRLITPSPVRSQELVDPPYLDRKIRLLQHLIAGLVARESGSATAELIAPSFELACRVARSPIVAATRAGWANQRQLFEAIFASISIGKVGAERLLTEMLKLPIPSDTEESVVAAWPDPFNLLVEAWYPPNKSVSPETELRDLGERIADGARNELAKKPKLRPALMEIRRTLRSIETAEISQRRLIVARRLEILDEVLASRKTGKARQK